MRSIKERHAAATDARVLVVAGALPLGGIGSQEFPAHTLITSRERLHLQAEWLFDVDGLAYPHQEPHASGAPHPRGDLTRYSAVQLFVQRATQVQPGLARDEATLTTIVQICQHVAGMPLAIELAAAVRLVPLSEIERQIRAHLDVLATTLRDVPARHRSMRAVFDHSWRLLSEGERALFSHVAVFRGGWTAQAAAHIAGATLVALTALVDKSLVRVSSADQQILAERTRPKAAEEPRFVMLKPIREYALEQLAARGEAAALQHAHASYYLALADAAAAQWSTPTVDSWLAQLDREYDNLRAALQWARDGSDPTIGLQLAGTLRRFWRGRGYLSEGRGWLEELLALNATPPDPTALAARLRALHGAAWLASYQHDFARATQLFEQSMALRRALGETEGEANLLVNAAFQARAAGQYGRATALLEEALSRHRAQGDRGSLSSARPELSFHELGQVLRELGLVVRERGDFARAIALLEEGLMLYRAIGDRVSAALALLGLGDVARDQGDSAKVREYCEPSLAILRESGM